MRAFLFTVIGVLIVATPARACEVTESRTVFSGMGTHLASYCKASEAEKKQALALVLLTACVPQKLSEWGKPVFAEECSDVIPYFFTHADALKSGPILDCRVTLERTTENGFDHDTGYRFLATGHKGPGARYDISEPALFTRDCPATGCSETDVNLCDNQQ